MYAKAMTGSMHHKNKHMPFANRGMTRDKMDEINRHEDYGDWQAIVD